MFLLKILFKNASCICKSKFGFFAHDILLLVSLCALCQFFRGISSCFWYHVFMPICISPISSCHPLFDNAKGGDVYCFILCMLIGGVRELGGACALIHIFMYCSNFMHVVLIFLYPSMHGLSSSKRGRMLEPKVSHLVPHLVLMIPNLVVLIISLSDFL